jgi:dolichyl-diphosphooligosaccharide--protein glycosyltransferase
LNGSSVASILPPVKTRRNETRSRGAESMRVAAPVPAHAGRAGWSVVGLLAAFVVALVVRAARLSLIFPGDGSVQFVPGDACYHARRALYSFANFPSLLVFDPYIAYPDGARVPIPPLYDWALAGVALLFGDSTFVFERVAVWAAPVLAALIILPVYAIGRRLGGAGVGVGAALLFAVLPANSDTTGVGNVDTDAVVAFLAASWLASSLVEALARFGARQRALRAALHGLIVAAMVLVWSGSLFYVLLGEGARLLASGIVGRHPDRLLAQSGGALLAAALVAPWVAWAGQPIGGPFAATTLSWLQVVVLVALAALAGGLAALERSRPRTSIGGRALRAGGLTLALALALLSVSALREPFASGAAFLTKQDVWAGGNLEQQPLFSSAPGLVPATWLFGWYAFLIPLTPLLVGIRVRGGLPREAAAILLAWTTCLGLLTMMQVRFARDFAAVAALVFAWTLAGVLHWLAPRMPWNGRLGTALVIAAGIVLLGPVPKLHVGMLAGAVNAYRSGPPPARAPLSPQMSMRRFVEEVRAATPETAGFLEPGVRPEYGILVPPSLGHDVVYVARRPVPANNLGPYLDAKKFDEVSRFYGEAENETEAVSIVERLGSRFVVTWPVAEGRPRIGPFLEQLHLRDGLAMDRRPGVERFRLVTEGPPGGTLLIAGRLQRSPFKLFELVAGAVLEAEGQPGALLVAEIEIETPLGRRFRYRAASTASANGIVRVRVPYATDGDTPARPTGPYRILFGGKSWRVKCRTRTFAPGERSPSLLPCAERRARRRVPRSSRRAAAIRRRPPRDWSCSTRPRGRNWRRDRHRRVS